MKYLICLLFLTSCTTINIINPKGNQQRARCLKIMTKTEAGPGQCFNE